MRIGVFDSGIGGLTVLRALHAAWPGHSTLYLGDTARVPYGTKSGETVIRYARQIAGFLLGHDIQLLVIACNTASAYAIEALSELPVPVVGVIEPGAQAAAATGASHIGVIGTRSTVASGAYARAIAAIRPEVRLSAKACPLFVPLVDEGWEDTALAHEAARRYLEDWLPGQPDRPEAVVLGCTHYPVLRTALAGVLGPEVTLIDSADATARAVGLWLSGQRAESRPEHRLFVTDGAEGFVSTAHRLLGEATPPIEVVDV